jgi:hypothetical protein
LGKACGGEEFKKEAVEKGYSTMFKAGRLNAKGDYIEPVVETPDDEAGGVEVQMDEGAESQMDEDAEA